MSEVRWPPSKAAGTALPATGDEKALCSCRSMRRSKARRMDAPITSDEFAEALRRLVGHGGDEVLDRETTLAVIEEQAPAMRECDD